MNSVERPNGTTIVFTRAARDCCDRACPASGDRGPCRSRAKVALFTV